MGFSLYMMYDLKMSVLLGIILHALGGVAAGSFYIPLKKVKRWSWESFWIVSGFASWIVAPWLFAIWLIPPLGDVWVKVSFSTYASTFLLGMLWGIGGLTFGLSVRYLGVGLGYAVTLGFCALFGTLVPPAVAGELGSVLSTSSGQVVLAGIGLCVLGIASNGYAGMRKEKVSASDGEGNREFNLKKGLLISFCSGLLSACMAFAISAGQPIANAVVDLGQEIYAEDQAMQDQLSLFRNNAVLCVVLLGGFVTNACWSFYLNIKNKSMTDYWTGSFGEQTRNYLLSSLGGVIWYGQFFLYGMGTVKLGKEYEFSSWTLHMAFIIVTSTLWGIFGKEWKGCDAKTIGFVWLGIILLITSTVVIGLASSMAH